MGKAELKTAKILEGTSQIQFVCPYCGSVQTDSTGIDVFLGDENKKQCGSCGKIMEIKHWQL